MTYGKRLQESMDTAKVDRKTLARELGVTPHAIGMVITGGGKEERWLSRENNLAAAAFLRVDPHWLQTGKAPTEQEKSTLSPHARAMAELFDKVPTADRVKWAIVYQRVNAIILEAIQGTPPTSGLGVDQETPAAQRQAPTATHKS